MPFKPGQSGNPVGRKPRTPQETEAAKVFVLQCKRLLPVALKRVEKILRDKTSEPQAVIRITEMLAERVLGKPAQAITADISGDIVIHWGEKPNSS